MAEERFDDEPWDEHRWETYLDEIEQRSEKLRKFIASDSDEENPRWLQLLKENPDILDAVETFIEEELQIEEAYFPDDEMDDDNGEDEESNDLFWDEFEEDWDFDTFGDEEDFDEGEEWKELSNDFTASDNGSIENLAVYNHARDFSVHVLQWTEMIHPKLRTGSLSSFVSNTLKVGAKLAGGYSFGFERDYLGANIACTKKALYAANKALRILADDLKGTPALTDASYLQFHGQLFELRNEIGIYVQELREQFNLGIE